MSIDIRRRLSHSAITSYAECGEKFRLTRGYHMDRSTWYATVAGTSIHYMTEQYDLGEPVPTFRDQFKRDLEYERDVKGREIKPSGREGKEISWSGGPNKKDFDWWLHFGPMIYDGYVRWRASNPNWVLLTLVDEDGSRLPAVELQFDTEIGGVPCVGTIDRVFKDAKTGQIIIVDLKTGKEPKGPLQGKTYDIGLKRAFDVHADFSAFLLPKPTYTEETGPRGGVKKTLAQIDWWVPPSALTYLPPITDEYADYLYEQSALGIESGIFLPSYSNLCGSCSVKRWCRAQGGEDAMKFPVWEPVNFYTPDDDEPVLTVSDADDIMEAEE